MGFISEIKDAVKIVQKLGNIELGQKLLEIQDAALELQEENIALRQQKRDLEDRAAIRESLRFDRNFYWRGDDGPYCSGCFDTGDNLIRLHRIPYSEEHHLFGCPACGNVLDMNGQSEGGNVAIRFNRARSMGRNPARSGARPSSPLKKSHK